MLISSNTSNNHLICLIKSNYHSIFMNPIDLDKDKPFNYSEILKKADEYVRMLESLNIAYPVLYNMIKTNRDFPYRLDIIKEQNPNLFY